MFISITKINLTDFVVINLGSNLSSVNKTIIIHFIYENRNFINLGEVMTGKTFLEVVESSGIVIDKSVRKVLDIVETDHFEINELDHKRNSTRANHETFYMAFDLVNDLTHL